MMISFSKFNSKLLVFVIGFCFGALVAFIFLPSGKSRIDTFILQKQSRIIPFDSIRHYNTWLQKHHVRKRNFLHQCDANKFSTKNVTLESQFLFDKVKIACIIFYGNDSEFHQTFNTWVKTCNSYYFVGAVNQVSSYVNSVVETHDGSNWKQFFNFVKNFKKNSLRLENFQWFFFAVDSNLLVIIENLRYLLAALNHEDPYYLGRTVLEKGVIFNVAEAGFVLSRASIHKLSDIFQIRTTTYPSNKVDFNIGKIFMDSHIALYSTLDDRGCTRFHSENLEDLFGKIHVQESEEVPCISDSAVTFSMRDHLNYMYFYFYILQRSRIVNRNDFMCDTLPSPVITKNDYSKWLYDIKDFFGIDPQNMTAKQFYDLWMERVDSQNLIF